MERKSTIKEAAATQTLEARTQEGQPSLKDKSRREILRHTAPPAGKPAVRELRRSLWTGPNLIASLAVAGILLHLLLRYALKAPPIAWQAALISILVGGGVPLVWTLAGKLWRREFGSDLLAGISIVTAVLLGEYLVGAIVVLMLSGGTALEQFASRRASSVLDALARRMPKNAHRKSAAKVEDVTLDEIAIGDMLVVFPHEVCPVDATVIEGHGNMNEAYLTGEPFEIAKTPGSAVLSGAINGEAALTIRAEKLPVDSRYAQIMAVMLESEQRRPRLRRLGDKLGAWYTPLALGLATLTWVVTGQTQRFLAVLVVATPCPLLIAIPVAVIGAISISARRGIIIKNPAALEQVDRCRTLIFDKTGTLTYGKPALSEALCAPGFERRTVLSMAASLERYSKHPLAGAILEAASKENAPSEPAAEISERPGEGLHGMIGGHNVWITGRGALETQEWATALPEAAPGLECVVVVDDRYAAMLRFSDEPRTDTSPFVKHLSPLHGVEHILIVSGDRDREVQHLAKQVGIKEVYSAKSPEEKVAIVRREAARGPTLFLGDGINDAPAMQAATVGVAFGANSDITSEAADAVVLETSLGRVDELMHIGKRMRHIALQSAVGGMALSLLGMFAAAAGYLPPVGGAVAQEVIDLLAVLNAVRVALPTSKLSDF
jgi:heavy metal translocating P-type ATPase